MSSIFKRVAIAAGAGLAVALSSIGPAPARRREVARPPVPPPPFTPQPQPEASMSFGIPADDVLYLDPIFDRLEALERRPDPVLPAPVIPDLSEIHQQIDDLRLALPGLVASNVESRLQALEPAPAQEVFQLAIREAVSAELETRLAALGRTLVAHADSLETLEARLNQTDANLQSLVQVITRLIEGPGLPSAPLVEQAARGTHAAASFEAHLSEAMKETPAPDSDAPAVRKNRNPLSRIF